MASTRNNNTPNDYCLQQRSYTDSLKYNEYKYASAEMLEALRIAEVHPPIEVAISREEEIGLFGVKNLDYSKLSAKVLNNSIMQKISTSE